MQEKLDKILNVSKQELDILDTNFIGQYNFFHDTHNTSYFHGKFEEEKYDLTSKGHWSGIGLVYFK